MKISTEDGNTIIKRKKKFFAISQLIQYFGVEKVGLVHLADASNELSKMKPSSIDLPLCYSSSVCIESIGAMLIKKLE